TVNDGGYNQISCSYCRLQAHSSLSKSNALVEDKQSFKQKKARIRAATRTLIILVCTYLMSNLLSVIITIWEYLDAASLFQKYLPFYVLSVAVLSLLTVIASCLRLPIYITCQPLLRKEMYQFLCKFCFYLDGSSALDSQDDVTTNDTDRELSDDC
ncbi:hypothetical protein OSTOST_18455, partial [Ostertagia ostertagi]